MRVAPRAPVPPSLALASSLFPLSSSVTDPTLPACNQSVPDAIFRLIILHLCRCSTAMYQGDGAPLTAVHGRGTVLARIQPLTSLRAHQHFGNGLHDLLVPSWMRLDTPARAAFRGEASHDLRCLHRTYVAAASAFATSPPLTCGRSLFMESHDFPYLGDIAPPLLAW